MLEILNTTYYGNTLWQWILSMSLILFAVIVSRIAVWLVEKFVKRIGERLGIKLDTVITLLKRPLSLVIVLFGVRFAIRSLTLPEGIAQGVEHVIMFAVALICAWVVSNCVEYLYTSYLVPMVKKTNTDIDDAVLGLLNTGLKSIIWSIGILVGLNNAGYDVGAVLAGLGIGGLAVAMAAQDSVSNFFGGVTLFIQKPFKIGDHVNVRGIDGWVHEIGLRSTVIADFYGRHHTIPNKVFIDTIIENIDRQPSYWQNIPIRLHHDTSPEKVKQAIEILKKSAEECPHVQGEVFAGHNGFGDWFIAIDYWYSIKLWKPEDKPRFSGEYGKKVEVRTEIYTKVMERFRENGIQMAMPVQMESISNEKRDGLYA